MSLEQKKAYRELVIRRDILKFILDLRVYNFIVSSHNSSDDININHYESYMSKCGYLGGRLKNFIVLADQGLVNFSAIDTYDDDLHTRIDELLKKCTDPEDREKIKALEREIFYMKASCPNISSLPLELLRASHTGIQKEERDFFLTEILRRTPFDTESKEYQFLMKHPEYTSPFIAYFEGKMPKEKVQDIYREVLKKFGNLIIAKHSEESYPQDILNMFARAGAFVDASIIDSLIESTKLYSEDEWKLLNLYFISRMIHNSNAKVEVDCKTYISSKLDGFDSMEEIASEFPKITEVLVQLCYDHEFLTTLTRVICSQKNSCEIADLVSKTFYSRYKSPEIGRNFNEYFLKAQERREVGTSLVLTLKAVKDIKENKQN